MSLAFLWMHMLVSVSGLLLLALRDTGAMGILLAIHLGFVLGLFLALPYGKFVHGLYRFLALVKYAGERNKGAFVRVKPGRCRLDQIIERCPGWTGHGI